MRGKAVVRERRDVTDSASWNGVVRERLDIIEGARGKWVVRERREVKTVQGG